MHVFEDSSRVSARLDLDLKGDRWEVIIKKAQQNKH